MGGKPCMSGMCHRLFWVAVLVPACRGDTVLPDQFGMSWQCLSVRCGLRPPELQHLKCITAAAVHQLHHIRA